MVVRVGLPKEGNTASFRAFYSGLARVCGYGGQGRENLGGLAAGVPHTPPFRYPLSSGPE